MQGRANGVYLLLALIPLTCYALNSEKALKTTVRGPFPWEEDDTKPPPKPGMDSPEITAEQAREYNGGDDGPGCHCNFKCGLAVDQSPCYVECCGQDPIGKISIETAKSKSDATTNGCNCNFGCPLWDDGTECYGSCCKNDIFGWKIPQVKEETEQEKQAAMKRNEELGAEMAKKRETCDCDFWCGPKDDGSECYRPCCL